MGFFGQKKLEVMISEEQLRATVASLGKKIAAHYAPMIERGEDLVVVGILKGSFLFMADLVRAIDLPLHIDFIALSSYGDETKSSGVVQLTQDLSKPIHGKHVLIVEDIIDTGLTMQYLLENLKTRMPASIQLACLLEKPSKNKSGIKADHLGFSIEDHFVVGYGLDAGGIYRNLPYIGLVTG